MNNGCQSCDAWLLCGVVLVMLQTSLTANSETGSSFSFRYHDAEWPSRAIRYVSHRLRGTGYSTPLLTFSTAFNTVHKNRRFGNENSGCAVKIRYHDLQQSSS
jgi:hypothetical protein